MNAPLSRLVALALLFGNLGLQAALYRSRTTLGERRRLLLMWSGMALLAVGTGLVTWQSYQ